MRRRPDDLLSREKGGILPGDIFDGSTRKEFEHLQKLLLSADLDANISLDANPSQSNVSKIQSADRIDVTDPTDDFNRFEIVRKVDGERPGATGALDPNAIPLDSVAEDVQCFTRLRAELRAWSQLFARFHCGRRPTLVDVRRTASAEVINKFETYMKLREKLRNLADEVLGDTLMIPGVNRKGGSTAIDNPPSHPILGGSETAESSLTGYRRRQQSDIEDGSSDRMVSIGVPRVARKAPMSPAERMQENARQPIAMWPSQAPTDPASKPAPEPQANRDADHQMNIQEVFKRPDHSESRQSMPSENDADKSRSSLRYRRAAEAVTSNKSDEDASPEVDAVRRRPVTRRRSNRIVHPETVDDAHDTDGIRHQSKNAVSGEDKPRDNLVTAETSGWTLPMDNTKNETSDRSAEHIVAGMAPGRNGRVRIRKIIKPTPVRVSAPGKVERQGLFQWSHGSESFQKAAESGLDTERMNINDGTSEEQIESDSTPQGATPQLAEDKDPSVHPASARTIDATASASISGHSNVTKHSTPLAEHSTRDRNWDPPNSTTLQVPAPKKSTAGKDTSLSSGEQSTSNANEPKERLGKEKLHGQFDPAYMTTAAKIGASNHTHRTVHTASHGDDNTMLGASSSKLELEPADFRLIGRVRLLGTEELHEFVSLRRSLRKWSEQFQLKYGRRPTVQDADLSLSPEDDAELRKRQCERYVALRDAMEALMKETYDESFLELLEKQQARLEMLVERIAKRPKERTQIRPEA
jgi:hypothetical protein